MNERDAPRVLVDQREGGTGDVAIGRNLQPLGDPLRQGRLAGPQAAHQTDHIPDAQPAAQPPADRFHGVRRRRADHDPALVQHRVVSLALSEGGFN